MKNLLQVIGWASVAAGLIMFVVAIRGDAPNVVAVSWLVSGVVSASIFLGIADVIGRLERLEGYLKPSGGIQRGAKAGYLPGWDPDEQQ